MVELFQWGTSILALLLSGAAFYYASLRPGKVVACLAGIEFKRGVSGYGELKISGKLTPSFFLTNVGARRTIITQIRLKFHCDDAPLFYAVPIDVYKVGNRYGGFKGIILSPNQKYENELDFEAPPEMIKMIGGLKGTVSLEIKRFNWGKKGQLRRGWITLLSNEADICLEEKELEAKKGGNQAFFCCFLDLNSND